MLLSLWQWVKNSKKTNLESVTYFFEFFSGIRGSKRARLYSLLFLIRRTLFCCIVIFFNVEWSLIAKISLYVSVQLIYLSLIMFLRPFAEFKDNMLEIINEVFYTILCVSLLYLNRPDRWNKVFENCYMGLILLNNIIFSLIALSKWVCIILNSLYNKVSCEDNPKMQGEQEEV